MFIKGLLLLLAVNFLSAGRLLPQPEMRIFGGKATNIESAPWQVSLRVNGSHTCGGAIYSENIIITAAQCLYTDDNKKIKAETFSVLAGSANKSFSKTIVKVAAVWPHKKYDSTEFYNDIGIVQLETELDLTTPEMQKIALADKDPAPGTGANVTGWGTAIKLIDGPGEQFPIGYIPDWLQAVDIQIQEQKYCSEAFYRETPKKSICGGHKEHTTCDGDSGGPLVVNNKLAGVVSRSSNRCTSLTVYTSVSEFRDWIENVAKSI